MSVHRKASATRAGAAPGAMKKPEYEATTKMIDGEKAKNISEDTLRVSWRRALLEL